MSVVIYTSTCKQKVQDDIVTNAYTWESSLPANTTPAGLDRPFISCPAI